MPAPPLDGVLVADFSRVLAGPLCTMQLGDLGADVVKIERPDGGDETRHWGPPYVEEGSTYYLGLNRNKRSVALDLGEEQDLALARELAARADVLVESFRPGVMARWGLDYATVARANPAIVYCSVSAFGSAERAAGLPGYDLLLQAVSGLMSVTGEPGEGGRPLKVGAAVVDMICGLYATAGVLAGLAGRERDGTGRHLEVSLMDSALAALVNQGSGYLLAGVVPERLGNRHPSIAPYETFATTDEEIVIAAPNDAIFGRLCHAIGRADLVEDARFATNTDRKLHQEELQHEIEVALAAAPAADWVARLGEAGVPAGPVNDVAQAYDLAERLGLEPVLDAEGLRLARSPMRFAGTAAEARRPPRLGEHDAEIRAWLSADPPPA